jgi:hypothetical protein
MIFARALGSLRPVNIQAQQAVHSIEQGARVVVKFSKGGYNLRRLGFYWVMLGVAAEQLSTMTDGPLDAEMLHRILKRKLELGTWTTLPSGERFFDEESISVATMSEPDRAAWVERVSAVLASWLGVPIETLMDEARAAA